MGSTFEELGLNGKLDLLYLAILLAAFALAIVWRLGWMVGL